jgi:DNA-binding MarR family transcriptional regulator
MSLRLIPAVHRATHGIALFIERHNPGLSQGEAHILAHLAEKGEQTVGQCLDALAHRRSTLTGILDRLEKRGAIERLPHEQDRRTFVVKLTGPGKKLAQDVHKLLAEVEARVLAELKGKQVKGFDAVLEAMTGAVAGKAPKPRKAAQAKAASAEGSNS